MRGSPPTRRGAWLEVDLDAIRHNVEVIRSVVGDGTTVAPVVKADAYGHGLTPVGEALGSFVDVLCVAALDEALALRAAGISCRLLLIYPVPGDGIDEAIEAGVELALMSDADVSSVIASVGRHAVPAMVHLAVETGMYRGGVPPERAASLIAALEAAGDIEVRGLWSHLASPDDADVSAGQVRRFEAAVAGIEEAGVTVPPRHLAASSAIFAGTAPHLELVRPGLAVYGVLDEAVPLAAAARAAADELRPAMSLRARAVALSDVPIGGSVGYGGRWTAARASRIATLPLGYGDGYVRGTEPGAEVLVGGQRSPVVGTISMDAIAVDVTDVPDLGPTTEFVLLGEQGDDAITAGELARRRNTIAWEVLSGMAARLDRVYHPQAGHTTPVE